MVCLDNEKSTGSVNLIPCTYVTYLLVYNLIGRLIQYKNVSMCMHDIYK